MDREGRFKGDIGRACPKIILKTKPSEIEFERNFMLAIA